MCCEGIMNPLVSIIMPAYNGEKFIEESINSVINQTYSNWELIIIDDCSTDKTREVIQKYNDKRIKVFFNDENHGVAKTTNKAIEKSSGKYIALLDDDDIALKNRLELQVAYMESYKDVDVLGGSSYCINDKSEYIGFMPEPRINHKYIKALLLFQHQGFANSTAMIRREFLDTNQLRFKDSCYGMQDLRFYIEASKVGRIAAVKDFLISYRYHEDNDTKKNKTQFLKERQERFAEFQRYSLEKSGYKLSEKQFAFVHKYFAEAGASCESKEELEKLLQVVKCIVKQAEEMKVDYYDELVHVCKTKLSRVFIRSDVFNWE